MLKETPKQLPKQKLSHYCNYYLLPVISEATEVIFLESFTSCIKLCFIPNVYPILGC